MTEQLTILNSTFFGENEDGTCLSCGYPTDRQCLCDGILDLHQEMMDWTLTLEAQLELADRIHFLISMRNLDVRTLRARLEATKSPALRAEWENDWGFGGEPANYVSHPFPETF